MRGATIVFDLDGTLVDTAPDLVRACHHVLGLLGLPPLPPEHLKPWISYGARRMIVEALAMHAEPRPEAEVDGLLDAFLAHYSANIAHSSRPFAGVEACLDRLAGRGARLAVCTNKREELSRLLLDALGLAPRFAALAGRDTFPLCKPDPSHLVGAIAMAGGDPRRAVMVGDSATDVRTARAAGIPVVVVSFGYTETPPADLGGDHLIDHFDELEPILDRLLGMPALPGRAT